MNRVLDLFSGAVGGWSAGMARVGYCTVAACESDPWRRAVFQANHPEAILYDDVRTLTADRVHADLGYLPDIIVGSPPCQEISAANCKGQGITDDHLFWDAVRLVFEIRPVWCAFENSPRARTAGIDGIIAALETANYSVWPLVVGADNAGANHRRKRLWLVAADAERHELWQQPGRSGGTRGTGAAVAGGDVPDARRPRHPLGPRLGSHDGAELPPALRAIGLAWPHWNGGLAGLSEACAAAGFGDVDDGGEPAMAPGLRNRAIAACGDAVVSEIPYAIGRAMMEAA